MESHATEFRHPPLRGWWRTQRGKAPESARQWWLFWLAWEQVSRLIESSHQQLNRGETKKSVGGDDVYVLFPALGGGGTRTYGKE